MFYRPHGFQELFKPKSYDISTSTSGITSIEISIFERIPPTVGSFYDNISRTFHRLRQWATVGKALTDVPDPLKYGKEGNNSHYIPAAAANTLVPSCLV